MTSPWLEYSEALPSASPFNDAMWICHYTSDSRSYGESLHRGMDHRVFGPIVADRGCKHERYALVSRWPKKKG